MFEDIIGTKKETQSLVGKLEKNGEVVENAVVDISGYSTKHYGYITCDDLEITDNDCFIMDLTYTKDGEIKRHSFRVFVKRLEDGRIQFGPAS